MAMVGELCIGLSLAGYRSLLTAFFKDEAQCMTGLLSALDTEQLPGLKAMAHTLKGAAASLGLHALAAGAAQIEKSGLAFKPEDCAQAARQLRELVRTAHALAHRMGLTESVPQAS